MEFSQPASASWLLGLQAWATVPGPVVLSITNIAPLAGHWRFPFPSVTHRKTQANKVSEIPFTAQSQQTPSSEAVGTSWGSQAEVHGVLTNPQHTSLCGRHSLLFSPLRGTSLVAFCPAGVPPSSVDGTAVCSLFFNLGILSRAFFQKYLGALRLREGFLRH